MSKTLLLSLMVLTGGFTLLSFMEGEQTWIWWFVGFAAVLSAYLFVFHPKQKSEKQPDLISVLPENAAAALEEGRIPDLDSDLRLKSGEKLYWMDQMRTDYYNTKPHLFYLSDQRLVCLDEDFRFSHTLDSMNPVIEGSRIRIQNGKAKMTFLCASPQAFENAWNLITIKQKRKKQQKQHE